ncbi:TPA: helix-turn-helix domain-containing protein [Streptococcus pyogenes]|uniref:helix-turn-helix domain-containing protein n=1 Tax=Streptococcus pyogenes TaxID=1314 RepID=UPI000DA3CAEB|nr:helix-turn-helix domain-containing protein [Streptococcus pyogenes]QAX71915.1 XRE family transcriptional regulator [Streptococcus pyogenes]SQG41804.1 putative transcriptional regulator [Streptococcus pyogenes]VGQ29941.1 putative transcriptional regulator [Streptococcus pyogenes]VGQ72482.1 putative transcriptional regulator [Streptococcus pyogenes]VGR01126.1 putative transcriptional regulator [Streptococcus pyogenes]
MLITVEHAEKVRVKRGRLDLTKAETAKRIKVTPNTLKKIETGDYDAPKAIFERVMNFLIDY